MEQQTKTKYLGHCSEIPFKKGDVVTIPKGAKYTTTKTPGVQETKCARKITVFTVDNGCNTYTNHREETFPPRNPRIIWVGGGGYWCDIDINEIV